MGACVAHRGRLAQGRVAGPQTLRLRRAAPVARLAVELIHVIHPAVMVAL